MSTFQDIEKARKLILTRIATAAQAGGRTCEDIELVAVSKRQGVDRIKAALLTGQKVFGENRVQEAQDHWAALKPDISDLELRLIGPLQSNKASDAVTLFDVIETLDRESLAVSLRKAMDLQKKFPRLYIQINTGEEAQKSGLSPSDLPEFLHRMQDHFGFKIEGLMCIPPIEEPASLHFSLLSKLARQNDLSHLSMGMSSDFETAVRMGATSVRVGSALFGERDGQAITS